MTIHSCLGAMMRAVFAKVLREEEAAVREIDRNRGVVRRKEDMCLLQVVFWRLGSSQKSKKLKL
jgi:hypothetical protein